MLGAVIGDIAGSRFEMEKDNIKTKEFELFAPDCTFTDDSVMSLAIAQSFISCRENFDILGSRAVLSMQWLGKLYPDCGFGGNFRKWVKSRYPKPYGSYGNGAAMRVGACGWVAKTADEAVSFAHAVTEVTHNHPQAMKGAEAVSMCIFLARSGKTVKEIRDYVNENYYELNFTLNDIRDTYRFDISCDGTVPQAITAFLESTDFEDAIRNAVSIGGDSDTVAAITGSIAEAYYGIPEKMRENALCYLDERLTNIVNDFESAYGKKITDEKT